MTKPEFNQWFSDLTTRFPSVLGWLGKVAPSDQQQRAVLVSWLGVLSDVKVADCFEVNRQMHAGDMPFVGEYDADKERLPQHVRRLARQLAAKANVAPAYEPVVDARQGSFPAGRILRRMFELTEAGLSSREAKEITLSELPITPPKWEPRYTCHLCQDTGRVTVASPSAIRAALKGEFEHCHHREGAVVCVCRPAPGERYRIVQFDQTKDYRVTDSLWGESETTRFLEWVQHKHAEALTSRRHAAFDSWNERAFA